MEQENFTDSKNIFFEEHFYKIQFVDELANQIGAYGVQCGNEKLLEAMDMKCGAIPEGEYQTVIDPSAPAQFLTLYTHIAEDRFAYAVTTLLAMNDKFINQLIEFCSRTGRSFARPEELDAMQAFQIYNSMVLDGTPGEVTKEILLKTEECVQWKSLVDTHEPSWKKAEGDIHVFYKLLEYFVNGIFSSSKISFKIDSDMVFCLKKL